MAVSRHIRAAWIVIGSVFTIATIGFGTVQAVAALAHEERTVRTTFDGPIRVINVEASGSVVVQGVDTDVVTITERVSDGLQHPDRYIKGADGVLIVRGTCGGFPETFCGDDFVLRVPRSVSVQVKAVGINVSHVRSADLTSDGELIWVRAVSGPVRLRSHGGGVTATALDAKNVTTESYGGDTTLSFRSPPRRVTASSQGGNILFVLPDDRVSYRVDASAAGGSTDAAIRTDPNSSRVLRARSSGGNVTIRYAGTGQ